MTHTHSWGICGSPIAHWRAARQALDNVCASDVGEIRAWRTFRAAVSAEGWLSD
jgi:hypothetical protein